VFKGINFKNLHLRHFFYKIFCQNIKIYIIIFGRYIPESLKNNQRLIIYVTQNLARRCGNGFIKTTIIRKHFNRYKRFLVIQLYHHAI
jgi:hypothetical protein